MLSPKTRRNQLFIETNVLLYMQYVFAVGMFFFNSPVLLTTSLGSTTPQDGAEETSSGVDHTEQDSGNIMLHVCS